MTTLATRISLLRSRIAGANVVVASAEREMLLAVSLLTPALVGEKRMGNDALACALARLKIARQMRIDLERLLSTALATPPVA